MSNLTITLKAQLNVEGSTVYETDNVQLFKTLKHLGADLGVYCNIAHENGSIRLWKPYGTETIVLINRLEVA